MNAKTALMNALPMLGAAIVACTLFAGTAAAKDQEFTVAYRVTTKGLDLSQPAGAHELYSRLQHAADVVCTHGMRVDLAPVPDQQACYEKALGNAVRSVNLPLLTQVYLESHAIREAAAHGIAGPWRIAGN